jgi:DNA-binding XRE family transcriptional regulator
MDVRKLGRRIAERRRGLEITQVRLADWAHVNIKTIQTIEQGRAFPEFPTLNRIAHVLGLSLDDLAAVASRDEGVRVAPSLAPGDVGLSFDTAPSLLGVELLPVIRRAAFDRSSAIYVLHRMARILEDEDLIEGPEEVAAVDVISMAAGYLQGGTWRGYGVGMHFRAGDSVLGERLLSARGALFGAREGASFPETARELVGILKTGIDEGTGPKNFMATARRRFGPTFTLPDKPWLADLLASHSPRRPPRGSGKRSLMRIAAEIAVASDLRGIPVRRAKSHERHEVYVEAVRKRIESACRFRPRREYR